MNDAVAYVTPSFGGICGFIYRSGMDAATASSSTVTRTLSAVDDKTAEAVASSSASAAGRPKRSAGTKKAVNVSPAAETAEVSAMPKTLPLAFESRVWRDAPNSIVVGVDEAGRGPLAGPVVAAACVIFPPSLWPVLQAAAALKESAGSGAGARSSSIAGSARSTVATTTTTTSGRPPVSGVNDSKQIDEEERELLYPRLIAAPELCFGVSVVDHAVIDRINILQATFLGMSRATASVREEACKRLREAGIDPASVAWSTSTSAATNSSPPEAAAAGPASSSSAAAETTIPQCLLHTVYIDGPKVPFRVGFAATPGGDDPDAPPAPTDDDADGAAGSNSASSSSSSTAGKAGAAGATTASFFSSAPDAGASDVELMGDDGGIQVTINADAGGQTAGAKSANQLAQKEWNVKFRPQIYTRGLQARLGTIHTVQPVIGGDAKVYCIAAGEWRVLADEWYCVRRSCVETESILSASGQGRRCLRASQYLVTWRLAAIKRCVALAMC